MPRPPKPYEVIVGEARSHRTKAELNRRKEGEKALASGEQMREKKEIKDNVIAHKEYLRLNKILKKIGKNDALYEQVINRYAMLYAECNEFVEKREMIYKNIAVLEEEYHKQEDEELTIREYFRILTAMQGQMLALDKHIQSKRKMMLDIEKENIMTIAAALRTIPKQVEKQQDDPLLRILRGG